MKRTIVSERWEQTIEAQGSATVEQIVESPARLPATVRRDLIVVADFGKLGRSALYHVAGVEVVMAAATP